MGGVAVPTEAEGVRERRIRGDLTTERGEKHEAVGELCGD